MTPPSNLWVYLSDMHAQSVIQNLTTGQQIPVNPASIADAAPIGLRGYLLTQQAQEGFFKETGEKLTVIDEELFDNFSFHYKQPNNWIYDYPNFALDATVDIEREQALRAILTKSMEKHSLKFEITGLQERSLLYFTDGSATSQKSFKTVMPRPNGSPYRRDGSLKTRYRTIQWSSQDRDKGIAFPKTHSEQLGGSSPCLYEGRAWVLRFKLEDQVPAFQHCRMYVMDDGTFIASDWCQRHDFSSYGGGINLQMGIYSTDAWIMGPCVSRAIQQGVFKPKTAKVKVEQVRELLQREPLVKRQTLAEAMADATKAVKAVALSTESAINPLVQAVKDVLQAKTELTDAQLTAGFKQAVAQTLENSKTGDGTKLAGVPFLITQDNVYFSSKAQPEPYKAGVNGDGKQQYRFVAAQGTCGATLQAGKICIRPNADIHFHPLFSQVTQDVEQFDAILATVLDEARQALKPDVDVPEITAAAMKEAFTVLKAKETERLEKERLDLLASNVATAQNLDVEVDPDLLPSVAPLVTTRDTPYGVAQLKRMTDKIIQASWITGPYEGLAPSFAQQDGDDLVSTKKVPGKATLKDWEVVAKDSPLGEAASWYFTEFLPAQAVAQELALQKAMTLTINNESFRCYPVVGGATICKVVDGAVIQAATVRQKANGHIYEVLDTGKTTLLDDESLKAAAALYFKSTHVPTVAVDKKELAVA